MKQDKSLVDNYGYTYDAFGRLVTIYKVSNSATVMAYTYNGLGHRISSNDGGGATTFYYVYDDQWRNIATYRNSDSSPKETFLYHNAGMDGRGGSSYIDEVILRDRDMTNNWTGAADGTREQRHYYAQNRHKDVVLLMKTTGRPWETIRYSAYGVPTAIAACDVSNDDAVDATSDTTGLAGDWNLDGTTDSSDSTEFTTDRGVQVGLGNVRTTLSISTYGNRKGYAGYEYDGTVSFLYHVRHRVLDSDEGRWTKKDPAGYVDGMSLWEYSGSRPEAGVDPSGLASTSCDSCATSATVMSDEGEWDASIDSDFVTLQPTPGSKTPAVPPTPGTRPPCFGSPCMGFGIASCTVGPPATTFLCTGCSPLNAQRRIATLRAAEQTLCVRRSARFTHSTKCAAPCVCAYPAQPAVPPVPAITVTTLTSGSPPGCFCTATVTLVETHSQYFGTCVSGGGQPQLTPPGWKPPPLLPPVLPTPIPGLPVVPNPLPKWNPLG